MKCAKLETTITINYEDGMTIGHRTTDSTKVVIRYISGYPTGKTILGAVAYPTTDIYGAILWVDSSGALRGVSKVAVTDYAVTILVFYKEP